MTTFFSRLLQLDIHLLEEAEQDALFEIVRAEVLSRKQRPVEHEQRPSESGHAPGPSNSLPEKDTKTLMARQTVTDDQEIILTYDMTDADKVAVEGTTAPVVVTTVDDSGTDVSQWINAAQDSVNPLKFVLSRKPNDDGTQPQEISFSSIGTLQVGGQTKTHQDDFLYTPGVPENLSSTVVIGSPPVVGGGDSAVNPAPQQQAA